MNKFAFLLIVLNPCLCVAQVLPDTNYTETEFENLHVNLYRRDKNPEGSGKNIRTSPFLFDDFRSADLYFTNKTMMQNMSVKFNCFTNELFYSEGNKLYVFKQGIVDRFIFKSDTDSSTIIFRNVLIDNGDKPLFLQVLYEGNIILYKWHHKEYASAESTGPYNSDRRINQYQDKPWYYVQMKDGAIRKLRQNEKSVVRLFSDRSEEISRFIRSNNIILSEERELVRLVNYYNHLEDSQ